MKDIYLKDKFTMLRTRECPLNNEYVDSIRCYNSS